MRRTLAILLVVGLVALLTIPALAGGDGEDGDRGGRSWGRSVTIDVEANLDSKNTSADSDAHASNVGNLNDSSTGNAYANGNDPGTNDIKNASVSIAINSSKKRRHSHGSSGTTATNTTTNTILNTGTATASSGAASATQGGDNNVNAISSATAQGCCDGGNNHDGCNSDCDNHENGDNHRCTKHRGIVINAELNKDSKNTSADSDAKVKYVGNTNYAYTGDATAYGNQGGGSIHNLSVAAAIGGQASATNTTTNSISNTGTATATSGNATANQTGDNNVNANSTAQALAN